HGPARLSRGLGQELLEPGAERGDAGRGDDGELVPAGLRGEPYEQPEPHPGILIDGDAGRAGDDHLAGPLQISPEIEAQDRGGDEPEVRKGGIAASDRGKPVEDLAESGGVRELLELGARIGDRDEAPAGLLLAQGG